MFRTSIHDQVTGRWSLSDAFPDEIESPDGRFFEHIQFNTSGFELAAIDNSGEIHLYTGTGILSRMLPSPSPSSHGSQDGRGIDAVVGLHWLPLFPNDFRVREDFPFALTSLICGRQAPYLSTASKVDARWFSRHRTRDLQGPKLHHPLDNRNALLYVTCRRQFHLW